MSDFNEILKKIPNSSDICLFPIRLETRFGTKDGNKVLRVRIIPDEILLDYHKKGLDSQGRNSINSEEAEDGKRFWIQWYIASGSKRREHEAWLNLCSKYPVSRASWICKCLKPFNFDKYKVDGEFFGHRPYPGISEIENACERIYKSLGDLPIDESGFIDDLSSPEDFEKRVTECCQKMLKDVYEVCKNLRQTAIVDYLYDSVLEMANHLKRRLDSIEKIYDEHPDLKVNDNFDLTKDLDYWSLNDLKKVVDEFIRDYGVEYRVSLPDLINEYLIRMDKKDGKTGKNLFFAEYGIRERKNFEIPEATFLPERFVFVGKPTNGSEVVFEGNLVNRDKIKLTIDPEKASAYSVDGGKLNVDESVLWMFDYGVAEKVGMAITVPIAKNVKGFEYIYVFGVKDPSKNQNDLQNLFNGHNYFGESLQLLDPLASTNVVEGELPASQEELERDARFEVEVNGKSFILDNENKNENRNDAELLSKRLMIDYKDCFGYIYNFDSERDSSTKKAYEILWKKICPDFNPEGSSNKDFVGNFFIKHVRATGNIPSIKIGNLPYGFLPISVYVNLRNSLSKSSSKNKKLGRLLDDLLVLKKKFDALLISKDLPSLKGTGAEQNYLKLAGQTPYSVSFIQRNELQSVLIEKNIPTLAGLAGKNLSFLSAFFEKEGCANQPVCGSDKVYHIEKSNLVQALECEGFGSDDAVRLATEFIDLFTYRLDAWFSGVLDFIMDDRSGVSANNHSQIGAYGWVFGLEEKESKVLKNDKDHFVIAPSLQHALSAAVLRSAYLKSKASATDSHVCVNLSSMRARQALRLVDAIRSGMSMSVVLGCDLERYLHDAPEEMDVFIYTLRQLFPQTINVEAKDSRAEDHAMQVINGEALLETIINHENWTWDCSVSSWLDTHFKDTKDERLAWLHDKELNMSSNQQNVFFRIIERLMDSYDALNDLLLSEGVHRLVMGDQASFSAISSFMATGEGGLPDPEILKTPSEHVVVSHKAAMMLPQSSKITCKPLSLAEPGVDAWIEALIGGMDKILFCVKKTEKINTYNEDADENKVEEQVCKESCSLQDVGVSASEYLYLSAFPATFTNYIETRWRLKTGDYTSNIVIEESLEGVPGTDLNGKLSLEEDAFRIQTIRSLLKKSHVLRFSDLLTDIQSDVTDESLMDKDELCERSIALLDNAKSLLSTMKDWLYQTSIVDAVSGELAFNGELDDKMVIQAYKNLCDCIEFGLANCFTGYNSEAFAGQYDKILQFKEYDHSLQVQDDLFNMVLSAKEDLEKRIGAFTALIGSREDEIKASSSERIVEAIQNLTLKNLKVFPKLKYDGDSGNYTLPISEYNLDAFVKNGLSNFKNVDAESFEQWQDEVAEVREGVKDVHNLEMAQIALDRNSFNVSILQTTTRLDGNTNSENPKLALLGEKWLGMPVKNESELRDVDSLILFNKENYETKGCAGFVFDAWLEYIPYKKHNAGLIFHCDRPDAEAPQSILLAVHPQTCELTSSSKWNIDVLKNILNTTSEMMKDRSVEPDDIYGDSELSRIFPLFGNKFGDQKEETNEKENARG